MQAVVDAEARYNDHQYEEVLTLLAPVLEEQPMHSHALHFQTGALVAMKRYEDAVSPALRLAVVEPQIPEARYFAGVSLFHVKRHREAIEHLEAVMHMRPTFLDARLVLAQACMDYAQTLQDYEPKSAELNYRRAAELVPESHEAILKLLRHYATHQGFEDAAHLISQLPPQYATQPEIAAIVKELEANPKVQAVLHPAPEARDHMEGVRILNRSSEDLTKRPSQMSAAGPSVAFPVFAFVSGAVMVGIGVLQFSAGGAAVAYGIALTAFGAIQAIWSLVVFKSVSES